MKGFFDAFTKAEAQNRQDDLDREELHGLRKRAYRPEGRARKSGFGMKRYLKRYPRGSIQASRCPS